MMKVSLYAIFFYTFSVLIFGVNGRVRKILETTKFYLTIFHFIFYSGDICQRQPSINGLCVTSTLGIYYDAETEHCKFVGCSPDKKLFASLEECEKICNGNRPRRRRIQSSKTDSTKS